MRQSLPLRDVTLAWVVFAQHRQAEPEAERNDKGRDGCNPRPWRPVRHDPQREIKVGAKTYCEGNERPQHKTYGKAVDIWSILTMGGDAVICGGGHQKYGGERQTHQAR